MFFPVYFGDSPVEQAENLQKLEPQRSEVAVASLLNLGTHAKLPGHHTVFVLADMDGALPRRNTVAVLHRLSDAQIDAANLMVAYWEPGAFGSEGGKIFGCKVVAAWDSLRVSVERYNSVETFWTTDPIMKHTTWAELEETLRRSDGVEESCGSEGEKECGSGKETEMDAETVESERKLFDLFHKYTLHGADLGRCAKNLLSSVKDKFFEHALSTVSAAVDSLEANYDVNFESWAMSPKRDKHRVSSEILKNKKHKNINPGIEKCRQVKIEIERCQVWRHTGNEASSRLSEAYERLDQACHRSEKYVAAAGILNCLVKKSSTLSEAALETAKQDVVDALTEQGKLALISEEMMQELKDILPVSAASGSAGVGA